MSDKVRHLSKVSPTCFNAPAREALDRVTRRSPVKVVVVYEDATGQCGVELAGVFNDFEAQGMLLYGIELMAAARHPAGVDSSSGREGDGGDSADDDEPDGDDAA